jgi:hypothetical protein
MSVRVLTSVKPNALARVLPVKETLKGVNTTTNKIKSWLHFERFTNGIQPRANNSLATYSELAPEYRPNNPSPYFSVPLFKISKERCTIYRTRDLDPRIEQRYITPTQVFFAVHPQIVTNPQVKYIKEITSYPQQTLHAAPTASSRTLFAVDTLPEHCIKLHFPQQITRSIRHLEKRKVELGLNLSADIAQIQNPFFGYLPETLGVVYQDAWGFLVRQMTPLPLRNPTSSLVPLFALYSPDTKNPNRPPVLKEMIEKSGMLPAQFILEKLFYPLLLAWGQAFIERGILLEAHGQNTLFELDAHGIPTRVIFRDFDTYVNREIREKRGLPIEGLENGLFRNEDFPTHPQGSIMSLIYDNAMRVPFDRIADFAKAEYGISKNMLQEYCRQFLHETYPEIANYFPKGCKVYNYPEGLLVPGSKYALTETNTSPSWR